MDSARDLRKIPFHSGMASPRITELRGLIYSGFPGISEHKAIDFLYNPV